MRGHAQAATQRRPEHPRHRLMFPFSGRADGAQRGLASSRCPPPTWRNTAVRRCGLALRLSRARARSVVYLTAQRRLPTAHASGTWRSGDALATWALPSLLFGCLLGMASRCHGTRRFLLAQVPYYKAFVLSACTMLPQVLVLLSVSISRGNCLHCEVREPVS